MVKKTHVSKRCWCTINCCRKLYFISMTTVGDGSRKYFNLCKRKNGTMGALSDCHYTCETIRLDWSFPRKKDTWTITLVDTGSG